ncbi:energy-coupling factor ABC transporter ATP-binding protein [Gulosibacter sp. ACHW.36C]|uniref:Energy-coupling factor ABC transporter ATP-binding protein n=1 Tax=Gulosibacter sediminis TaxID=1729695 RepID=A0ABY4MVJ2_9MICO|nr:ABC transporter ATP-binding protein [Gulosibacter sediminis]UQN13735.1 energy-coupling factor ABC transporter ATP-binding protein [Gulosibacter sediminis]
MTDRELSFDRVRVVREGRVALDDVTLTLDEHRIAVVGENGSGKSTLARLLNGLVTATSGEVRVHGRNPAREGAKVRSQTGFVFPNPSAQVIMPTVREDLAFSFRGRKLSRAEIAAKVEATLGSVGLSALADVPAHSLSSGQQQLLAVAAVLAVEPGLVIADEPTALLDLRNRSRIAELLLDRALPHQLVLVTHDLELAERCDVAVWVQDARVTAVGRPADIVARYRASVA